MDLDRKSARVGIVAIGLGFTLVSGLGCASAPKPTSRYATPAAKTASLAEAPEWLLSGCRAHWSDPTRARHILCGVGSAPAHRDHFAARETAITRGRAEIARSLEVTIESLVRLEDRAGTDCGVDAIVHQLSNTSMRGVQLEQIWRDESGQTYALVSLDVTRTEETVRDTSRLQPATRASLAAHAAAAFAALEEADGSAR